MDSFSVGEMWFGENRKCPTERFFAVREKDQWELDWVGDEGSLACRCD